MNYQKIYLDLMVEVIKADNKVYKAEKDNFIEMMIKMGLPSKVRNKFINKLDDKKHRGGADSIKIPHISEPGLVLSLLRDAYFLAAADGEISDSELELIKSVLLRFGVKPRKISSLLKWCAREREHHIRGLAIFE